MPGKIIRVDIDGTICKTNGVDYINATPILDRIVKINRLYNEGNEIIYWTARGALNEKDWTVLTKAQLKRWKCKYTRLDMNKPLFDEFYDDRAFNAAELDNQ